MNDVVVSEGEASKILLKCVDVVDVQETVLEVLKNNIELNCSARGVLIDGFPRTMQQLEQYETHVRTSLLICNIIFNCILQVLSVIII